jgi:SAM-dependent methyltransferase
MKNEQIVECLLCGNSAELKHNEYPGYQEPAVFKIFYCPSCNTSFSLPRVEASVLSDLYEKIYLNAEIVPGYNRYWKLAQVIKNYTNPLEYLAGTEDVYWSVQEALALSVKDKNSIKIIEIGSGLGYLTYSLVKAGYDATGLDISQTAVEHANKTFGDHFVCADLFEYTQFHSGSFDIVILTEVIEHTDKPINFIESIIKLLKPDGQIIITTPNKSFYTRNIIWASDAPPVHCWWFSEESVKYIAARLNMNIRFIKFSDYYKNKNLQVNMRSSLINDYLPRPLFDKDGKLIVQVNKTNRVLRAYMRLLVKRIPYANKIYRKFTRMLSDDVVVCSDRGIILCCIIYKNPL